MLISIIITVLLLYVAFNTKLKPDGDKLPNWCFYVIALLTLCSWESAIVMLGICIYALYKGVNTGQISTLNWIENLVK